MDGTELSQDVALELRNKPGSERIRVAIGDMATTKVQDPFRLVYLLAKTVMNLTTQNSHVDCFVNASSHLQEAEAFVVEVMALPSEGFRPVRRSCRSP